MRLAPPSGPVLTRRLVKQLFGIIGVPDEDLLVDLLRTSLRMSETGRWRRRCAASPLDAGT